MHCKGRLGRKFTVCAWWQYPFWHVLFFYFTNELSFSVFVISVNPASLIIYRHWPKAPLGRVNPVCSQPASGNARRTRLWEEMAMQHYCQDIWFKCNRRSKTRQRLTSQPALHLRIARSDGCDGTDSCPVSTSRPVKTQLRERGRNKVEQRGSCLAFV